MSLDESSSPLATAIYEHFQATVRLIQVALMLEWTIFTRFVVGVILATILSVLYLVFSLRNARQPLVIWERLNKPLVKLFRAWIFAWLLGNADPYVRSIGSFKSICITIAAHWLSVSDLRISTFSRGFCTGIMRVSHFSKWNKKDCKKIGIK